MNKIIIAIDGFSSCGKSTMAKSLAKKIGYIFIDSGAMYRAITYYCIKNNLFDNDTLNINKLEQDIKNVEIAFKLNEETGISNTYLNNICVETEIRTMEVSEKVSIVSTIGFVRHAIVQFLQKMGKDKGIVMDGRDIGTVVFPQAELKIFVTAKPEIRAQRRLDELRSKGDNNVTLDEVLKNIEMRDHIDQTRKQSPLKQAPDAIVLDNSYMTINEQMDWLLNQFNHKMENIEK